MAPPHHFFPLSLIVLGNLITKLGYPLSSKSIIESALQHRSYEFLKLDKIIQIPKLPSGIYIVASFNAI